MRIFSGLYIQILLYLFVSAKFLNTLHLSNFSPKCKSHLISHYSLRQKSQLQTFSPNTFANSFPFTTFAIHSHIYDTFYGNTIAIWTTSRFCSRPTCLPAFQATITSNYKCFPPKYSWHSLRATFNLIRFCF